MLEKGFLKRKYSLSFERWRIWFTILIAIAYSIAFYLFLVFSREILRHLSFMSENESLLILSNKENFFYNFFFASLASLTGFSVAMDGLIKTQFQLPGFVRHSITNDQTALQWYVNFWVTKLGVFYAIMCSGIPLFEHFDFYRDYWFLFPSIIVVLYFNQWMKFRLFLRADSKWMWYSGIVVITFSGFLASLPIINYDGLNHAILKNTILYNYSIELPKSLTGKETQRRSLEAKVYLGVPKNSTKDSVVLIGSNGPMSTSDFEHWLINEKEHLPENERDLLEISIRGDRKIKMSVIKTVFSVLLLTNTRKVKCVTSQNGWGIPFWLTRPCPSIPLPNCRENLYKRLEQKNTLHLFLQKDSVKWNNDNLPFNELVNRLTMHIEKYPDYLIDLRIDDESSYGKYIALKDTLYHTLIGLRDRAARKNFGRPYKFDSDPWEDKELQDYVTKLYPINIVEWNDQDRSYLEKNKHHLK